jgi:galactokinase/mevalonate kinase-like predicted kinase
MIISKTPLRVSFAGGGADIRDYYKTGHGEVVSSAFSSSRTQIIEIILQSLPKHKV